MKANAIQLLSNLALSASLLFIPNLAKDLGASNTEVGLIGAVYGIAMFTSSYIFGRASDVYSQRFFIRLGLAVSALTFFLQVLTDPSSPISIWASPSMLAFSRGLVGFSFGMFPPALTAYVYEAKKSMGEFTSFGALGWSVGTFVAGLLAMYWNAFLLSSASFTLAFLVSLTMPSVKGSRLQVPLFPKKIVVKNWYVYIPYLLRHTGASCIWIIYPLYIASLGGDKFWIGVIYTVNTGSQFIVMRYADRYRDITLLNAGLILSLTTFLAFTVAQSFYQLLPIQVLLASSWSCLYVGSLLYLMKHNVEKATSTGLLDSVIHLSGVFGAVLGGVISQLFEFKTTMYAAALLTAVGFILFRAGIKRAPIEGQESKTN